jgi:RNA polymerase sigma-70 factor (ECF subfamily)
MEDMEQIYNEYSRQVYRYIYSLCHDNLLSEELTQETFFRAVKNINSYNGNCKLYVWLCQIAKHVWYQELNKRKNTSYSDLDENLLITTSLEDDYLDKENKKNFFRNLHDIPDAMREVVFLRIAGDFSFREIGEIIGKDENWARVNFYRAKQKIMKGRSYYEM